MSIMRILRIPAFVFALIPFLLFADEVRGRVVRVADGDTITVLSTADPAPVQHKIRSARRTRAAAAASAEGEERF